MKVKNTSAGFEQFALSTEEVAMVKGGLYRCTFYSNGVTTTHDYGSLSNAYNNCASDRTCKGCGQVLVAGDS